ncbi:MAG: diguanylate cyclase [Gammaproteobacteria bacterium]|nr:diguanylate cyclase [Gammaproteobacteria bacterium]
MAQQKGWSKAFLSQPLQRVLMAGFLIIAFAPMCLAAFQLYQDAWDNAWRELNEKHRLLAENLASSITIYIGDRRKLLALLADQFNAMENILHDGNVSRIQWQLDNAIQHMDGLRSLSLIAPDGNIHVFAQRLGQPLARQKNVFSNDKCFLQSRDSGSPAISGIQRSPVSGAPAIVLSHPIRLQSGSANAVLLAELNTDPVEQLRKNIHFGESAHANAQWMEEIKDLSHLPVVKLIRKGKTGVTEFFSPDAAEHMVAGYAAMPETGWGIMVLQPKREVAAQVSALLRSQFVWGITGLAIALGLAAALARWITVPIKQLASAADDLDANGFYGDIPALSGHVPKEISQLGKRFRNVISGLQQSRAQISELNQMLQVKIEAATEKLRDANIRLEHLATSDYLTEVADWRQFEKILNQLLERQNELSEPVCIMVIDIDNFREINDRYGHAAGDAVLIQIAPILKINLRPSDLVARYGGDEFVIQMNCAAEIGMARAQEIRACLQNYEFDWQGQKIKTTVTIGLLHPEKRNGAEAVQYDIETLLHEANLAMHNAKTNGRNTVVQISY